MLLLTVCEFCCAYVQKFDINDSELFVVTTTNREEIKNDITYSMLCYYFKYMMIYIMHVINIKLLCSQPHKYSISGQVSHELSAMGNE